MRVVHAAVELFELFVSSAFPFLIVLRVDEKKTSAFKKEYRPWKSPGTTPPTSGGVA
jgi:hypothetical protein